MFTRHVKRTYVLFTIFREMQYAKMVQCLEETINLTSLGIDIDVDVAGSSGQTGNGLDISSESIPA